MSFPPSNGGTLSFIACLPGCFRRTLSVNGGAKCDSWCAPKSAFQAAWSKYKMLATRGVWSGSALTQLRALSHSRQQKAGESDEQASAEIALAGACARRPAWLFGG